MKTKELKKNDKCFSCEHFGYCQIYWGVECKRQGGKRTPRLKSQKEWTLIRQELDDMQKMLQKRNFVRPKLEISQPIITKRANWG